jgi:SAM-dependent methyltransferase
VTVVEAPAEQVPLPDHSFDVVTAAQAWHWFDQGLAPTECARLLRPGGLLSLVWNQRDESSGWVGAAWAPVNRDGTVGMSLLADGWQDAITATGLYGPVEAAVFHHEQQLTRDAVLQLITSRSSLAVLAPPQREALLSEVAEVLDTHPDARGRDELTIPYDVHCYRWRRGD